MVPATIRPLTKRIQAGLAVGGGERCGQPLWPPPAGRWTREEEALMEKKCALSAAREVPRRKANSAILL